MTVHPQNPSFYCANWNIAIQGHHIFTSTATTMASVATETGEEEKVPSEESVFGVKVIFKEAKVVRTLRPGVSMNANLEDSLFFKYLI